MKDRGWGGRRPEPRQEDGEQAVPGWWGGVTRVWGVLKKGAGVRTELQNGRCP